MPETACASSCFAPPQRTAPVWLAAYFSRIKLAVPDALDAQALAVIHYAHVNAIAYDMLDVFLGIAPVFDLDEVAHKLSSGERGGGCTQMNGLLAAVLEALGFQVRRTLSAVVRKGAASNVSTHMVLIVAVDGEEWLCDVAYGFRGFLYPLPLQHNTQTVQGVHEYRVQKADPAAWSIQYRHGLHWQNLYLLRDAAYPAHEFMVGQFFNSYSPLSPFTSTLVCAKPSLQGGSYLNNQVLVSIRHRVRTQRTITSLQELSDVLSEYFDIHVHERDWATLPSGMLNALIS